MRYINGECWPTCNGCERQLPTLDPAELLRLGWAIDSDGEHYCHTCRQTPFPPATQERATVPCGECEGRGGYFDATDGIDGRAYWATCHVCGGSGKLPVGTIEEHDAHLGAVRDDCA